jgi:hypothetical protein
MILRNLAQRELHIDQSYLSREGVSGEEDRLMLIFISKIKCRNVSH